MMGVCWERDAFILGSHRGYVVGNSLGFVREVNVPLFGAIKAGISVERNLHKNKVVHL